MKHSFRVKVVQILEFLRLTERVRLLIGKLKTLGSSSRRLVLDLRLFLRSCLSLYPINLNLSRPIPKRIVIGPFLGEVGFELLYWIPLVGYLQKFIPEHLEVIVISRGGMGAWYQSKRTVRYFDALSIFSPDLIEKERIRRQKISGVMKQNQLSEFEKEVIRKLVGESPALVLHPKLMVRHFARYWSGKQNLQTIVRTMIFTRPDLGVNHDLEFKDFISLRLYKNDVLTEVNGEFTERLLSWVNSSGLPILNLDTGVNYDDHRSLATTSISSFPTLSGQVACKNLHVQAQAISQSANFICTHGGLSYFGPLLGTPTVVVQDVDKSPNPQHTALISYVAKENQVGFSIATVKTARL